jgi:predicted RNase H-like HicB family nuclease
MTASDARANLQDAIDSLIMVATERDKGLSTHRERLRDAIELLVEVEVSIALAAPRLREDELIALLRKARGHA